MQIQVQDWVGLCSLVARDFAHPSAAYFDDLVQEGTFGLLKAAEVAATENVTEEHFAAFARPFIRFAIRQGQDRLFPVPNYAYRRGYRPPQVQSLHAPLTEDGLTLEDVVSLPDPDPDPDFEHLHAALERLSATDRKVLEDRYWHNLGPSEMAAREGVTPRVIQKRLWHARRRLKAALFEMCYMPTHGATEPTDAV
jgi:RNA polymerase sigma factor (sigma-70 family)